METIWARKYGKEELPNLSVQELVDCNVVGKYKNWACEGGFPTNAFAYVRDNGVGERSYYPYESKVYSFKFECFHFLNLIYFILNRQIIVEQKDK